jgi:antitoxin component HigA of HigAB toxin-antitoxin module
VRYNKLLYDDLIDVLVWLMQEHGLEQKDLPEIGPQPVVAALMVD